MSSDTDSSDENYEKPSLFPKFHKTGAKDAARRRTAIRRKKLFSRMYAEQAKLARESIGIEDQLKARWREMEQEDAEEKLKQQEFFGLPPCTELEMEKFNKIKAKYGEDEIPSLNMDWLINLNKINAKCAEKLKYLNKHRNDWAPSPKEGGKKSRRKKTQKTRKNKRKTHRRK